MAVTATPRRRSVATRRVGYLFAAAINAAMVYAIHVWPGWRELPILTEDTSRVLGLITLSLVIGAAWNLVYVVGDPPWLTALGNVVITAIGFAVLVRIWQVFPFDFSDSPIDWAMVARVVVAVAIAGSAIGAVAQLAALGRAVAGSDADVTT